MITALDFMLAPFVVSILLMIITVYFGLHVIEREIIFIDIALAQIAAFGSAITLVLHSLGIGNHDHAHEHDSRTFMAYLLCLVASLLFTLLKNRKIRIPLEALIGIAYAVATTAAVIILDKGAGSDIHIHDMLAGNILWVTWPQIIRLAIIIGVTGTFHFIFRKKFKSVTLNYRENKNGVSNARLWDFLFYLTFSIVIVEAVSIGGILTIFAFLIIPATISSLFSSAWVIRIITGATIGTISTLFGLYFSWTLDVPCTPLIVIFLGTFLILSLLIRSVLKIKTK